MFQPSKDWDWHIGQVPSTTGYKIYLLFLFAVCVLTTVKLLLVWRAAPPFRLSRKAGSAAYLLLLETYRASLSQWIGFTFLGCGVFLSASLYDVCDRLLGSNVIGSFVLVLVIQGFSTAITRALVVVLFMYLIRWHMLRRIERLHRLPD